MGLSLGLDRVSRVDPAGQPDHTGFFLPPFFHQPGPVPDPGRPGPGSTRRAGPGFKTMVSCVYKYLCLSSVHYLLSSPKQLNTCLLRLPFKSLSPSLFVQIQNLI